MKSTFAMAAAAALVAATSASARDQVQIAGSSTVLPYAQIVAEAFGESYKQFKTPVVGSGGSSGGLREFCRGAGPGTIDIANSSRPIRSSEVDACKANGVAEVMEIRIGYDGIVFASDINGPEFKFEPKDWFLAIAEKVVVDGKVVNNPVATWNQVNPAFPSWAIAAYIPGEKHGTREVFEEKVLHAGCKAAGALDAMIAAGMSKEDADKQCIRVRKDGKAVDIDGDYTETLARIAANRTGMGVFGLAFYENNTDKLRVATMSGVAPSVETIASGKYPVSRPLFFYVKKAHLDVIPGLREYVEFFISDDMVGPGSPLANYGLVPAPKAEREAVRNGFASGKTM